MNGKRAKAIRRQAIKVAKDYGIPIIENREYVTRKTKKKFMVLDKLAKIVPIVLDMKTVNLHSYCEHGLYKRGKTNWKRATRGMEPRTSLHVADS